MKLWHNSRGQRSRSRRLSGARRTDDRRSRMAYTREQINRAKTGTHWIRWSPGQKPEEVRVVQVKAVCAYVVPVSRPVLKPIRLNGTATFSLVEEDDYRTPR